MWDDKIVEVPLEAPSKIVTWGEVVSTQFTKEELDDMERVFDLNARVYKAYKGRIKNANKATNIMITRRG